MLPANSRESYSQSSFRAGDRPLLVHHVARICGISCRTVRWAAVQGLLVGFKDPRTPKIWRFWRTEVMAFIERRQPGIVSRHIS
jgi:hypothetical protein